MNVGRKRALNPTHMLVLGKITNGVSQPVLLLLSKPKRCHIFTKETMAPVFSAFQPGGGLGVERMLPGRHIRTGGLKSPSGKVKLASSEVPAQDGQ